MIELSGLVIKDEERPDGDIEIKITGLLPGEKLYEELLLGETSEGTIHPKVFRANEEFLPLQSLEGELEILEKALGASDVEVIQLIMQKLVTGYTPHDRLANG
jgi:FlaA1/EpsC-like NDP-sugar epimerase